MRRRNRPLRVLIVDDNTDLAYMMSVLVQKCGHECRSPTMGRRPSKWPRRSTRMWHSWTLRCRKMDGFCVARELRESGNVQRLSADCRNGICGRSSTMRWACRRASTITWSNPSRFALWWELLHLARNRLVRSVEERSDVAKRSPGGGVLVSSLILAPKRCLTFPRKKWTSCSLENSSSSWTCCSRSTCRTRDLCLTRTIKATASLTAAAAGQAERWKRVDDSVKS